ncbi:unnamed protein product [Caenorhabditis angaria]|uniref:LisH domain-containing protein n=1 Tax=Caenorhabditis angaria TaxID=860376 RepID=A0A9P1MY60_9PELO|nr:unnamed protein product [Caenorhabditis angaria]
MKTSRKPPRRPSSTSQKNQEVAKKSMVDQNLEDDEAPPDPKASNFDVSVHCLLREIDDRKLILLISGHPSARSTALILQALRQQMSVATLDEYVADSLDWLIENDVLMLKMKKNSIFCRVLQADGVDSREQMARLVNTMASYPAGRNYFTANHKIFLPCLIAVLRGKRLPSTTHDQLIACVQKLSIRATCQKELIQNGMLEWAVNHLDQKLNNYAFEYLAAMIVNLSINPISHSLITRLADSIANSIANLISKITHGPSCTIYNNLLLSALTCARIRLRAKDTKLLEAIKNRLETRKSCPLCNLHLPYLIAIIQQEVPSLPPPSPASPEFPDTHDKFGKCCEREIDSLDPLRPSTNELSGARLLQRKASKEHALPEVCHVPGQVPYHAKARAESSHRSTSKSTGAAGAAGNLHPRKRAQQNEPRIGTATSQHTFIIETEKRKPIMVNLGLVDGALELRKSVEDRDRKKEEEEKKKKKEKEEKDRERQKALRHIQLTSRKAPSLLRKELSDASSPLEDKIEKLTSRKSASKLSLTSKKPSSDKDFDEKINNNNNMSSFELSLENGSTTTHEDYSAIFGSRPKVARTPDTNQQSKSFF